VHVQYLGSPVQVQEEKRANRFGAGLIGEFKFLNVLTAKEPAAQRVMSLLEDSVAKAE
jgi:hypothetical protein